MIEYNPTKAQSNTMLLFSTPVFIYDTHCSDTNVHDTTNEQPEMTLNQGQNFTSVNHNVLELDHYSEIKSRILDGLDVYVNDVMCLDKKHIFYITQSWLNFNPPGTAHHKHNHSNSIISGVYYIETDETDGITFSSKSNTNITANETLTIDVAEYNLANSRNWTIPVSTNSILYFPSTTLHEVAPNKSNKTRISLAFNAFVKGQFGTTENLNELQL